MIKATENKGKTAYGETHYLLADSGQKAMSLELISKESNLPLIVLVPFLEGYLGPDYPYRYWEVDGRAIKVISLPEVFGLILPALKECFH